MPVIILQIIGIPIIARLSLFYLYIVEQLKFQISKEHVTHVFFGAEEYIGKVSFR